MPATEISETLKEARERIELWKSENPASLQETQSLNLSGIGLTDQDMQDLMPDLEALPNLEMLVLENNRLTRLPETIGRLQSLHGLGLTNNQLTELPSQIGALTNLMVLQVNKNRLTELPKEIGELANLLLLEAGNNKISRLPEEIVRLTNLEELGLTNNQLIELPETIGQLTSLKSLQISNNQIAALPDGIQSLNNLLVLSADHNQLTRLPEGIKHLTNLTTLELGNNSLQELSGNIGKLVNLEELGLSYNQIPELPTEIGQLKKLNTLGLDYNKITRLPETIGQLSNLEKLGLNNNQLTELTPQIGKLNKLTLLKLANNNLRVLTPEITNLTQLQALSLNNNYLQELPEQIGKLNQLVLLDIANNRLTTVPSQIQMLNALFAVDLTRNPLSDETLQQLMTHFPPGGNTEVKLESESIEQLSILYPELLPGDITLIDRRIGRLNQERPEFTDGNDQKPGVLPGDKVVDTFLAHVRANHGGPEITNLYHNAAKDLFERAIGSDNIDSEAALTQMASSLGNCPTPVSDLMEKTGVQLAIESGEAISSTLKVLLHRRAFEELIKRERIVPFSSAEPIETVQGLTNALFMVESERVRSNSLRISGNRPRIAPKTQNIDFAFEQVTDAMRERFAKLCCETDNQNNLVIDRSRRYKLDPAKYFAITESYVENQGILDTRARARKAHINELKELMSRPENIDLSVDPDLVDFKKIEDNLRLQMREISSRQINDFIQQNLEAYKAKMEEVREEYGLAAPQETTQTTNRNDTLASQLEGLTIATNQQQRRRAGGPEDRISNRRPTDANQEQRRGGRRPRR